MQKIKNNFSYSFLISSILLTHYGYINAGGTGAGAGKQSVEMFVRALPAAGTVKDVTDDVGINSTNRLSESLDKATASSEA